MPNVREVRTAAQADQEDVFFGQTVIMWARWSVIVAGIMLVLWTSTNVSLLTQTMPFFLVLMAVNFFLHGRYVMGSPLNRTIVTVASVIDLVLITAIVVLWPGAHGLNNQFSCCTSRSSSHLPWFLRARSRSRTQVWRCSRTPSHVSSPAPSRWISATRTRCWSCG